MTEHPRVFVLPYLGCRRRVDVGPFQLVPWADLDQVAVAEPWLEERLKGLEQAYDSPVVFAMYQRQPLGIPPPDELLRPLRFAVLMGSIADFPALDDAENNFGWGAITSDHALAFIHPIPQDSGIAVEFGFIIRKTVAGLIEGTRGGVPKPIEIVDSLAPPDPDPTISTSVFEALVQDSERARRLGLAIGWLEVAWRNTEAISQDLRIVALLAGFEAILMEGNGADSYLMATQYDSFVDDTDRRPRTVTSLTGKESIREYGDSGWWLLQFAWLRNQIAHGGALRSEDYEHEDGRPHFAIAEKALREAILREAGHLAGASDLLDGRFSRQMGRLVAETLAEARESETEDRKGDPDTEEPLAGPAV